jgi:predicted MFS family arabinose efflux permease
MPDPASARREWGLARHGDFRRLWAAQTVSDIGSEAGLLAVPLVAIYTLHASTLEVGALSAAETAAFLFLGLPAGVLVDRARRRPAMVAADWGRALLLGSVPLAYALGWLTLWQLFVVASLSGVLTVLFDVASQSYLPFLVGRRHLEEGNAKLTTTQQVAHLLGPPLGGWLVQLLRAPYALLADAVSFVVSAVSVTTIRTVEPARPPSEQRHLGREIAEGLRFVNGQRLLRAIAAASATFAFFSTVGGSIVTVFLVRTLGLSAAMIGVLLAAASLGGLLGAALATTVARRIGSARTIWAASLLPPLAEPGWRVGFFVIGQAIFGFAASIYNVAQVSFRQRLCPDRLLGRMNATMRFIVWGCMPLGGLSGGSLGSALGVRTTLWLSAAGASLAPVWLLLSPLRRMRDVPDAAAEG